ncbi:MAG: hypothetical protein H0U18_08485 [Pyrinomonadaceae bacterium]|nr:hypothetical protein [Pyrinomonadaceae bacterium]
MVYAELIFETGTKSVGCYQDEHEALAAVKAHHDRARNGESGGPTGAPAERIVKVELYDKHPADYEVPALSQELAVQTVKDLVKANDGAVSAEELAAAIRGTASPLTDQNERHESMYKMPSNKSLTAEKWEN